jgi:four helix bundle protein
MVMAVRNFKDLIVWQKGIELVESIYRLSEAFPKHEVFGLTGQLRRASVSIPSNIAEGQGRGPTQDFVRFLQIARGSLQEVHTQLVIAQRLAYVSEETCKSAIQACDEVARLLNGLIRSIDPRKQPASTNQQPPTNN